MSQVKCNLLPFVLFCLGNFDFYSFELFERHESLFMYAARSTSQHLVVYIIVEFIYIV